MKFRVHESDGSGYEEFSSFMDLVGDVVATASERYAESVIRWAVKAEDGEVHVEMNGASAERWEAFDETS